MREHPEGYGISSFPRLFVDRYGYHLDFQKLGYQKLAPLLQIMPEVKVESTYIFPSVPAVSASDGESFILQTQVNNASHAHHAVLNPDSELSDSALEDDNMESPWQKLGYNQSNMESKLSQKAEELDTPKLPDYEPIVSDYDSSESEGDSQPEKQGKLKCNKHDISLWQALDLWHNKKEGENSVKKPDNVGHLNKTLVADILNSSAKSTRGT